MTDARLHLFELVFAGEKVQGMAGHEASCRACRRREMTLNPSDKGLHPTPHTLLELHPVPVSLLGSQPTCIRRGRSLGGANFNEAPHSTRAVAVGYSRLLVTSHWPVSCAAAAADAVRIAASVNHGGGRRLLVTSQWSPCQTLVNEGHVEGEARAVAVRAGAAWGEQKGVPHERQGPL